jgi:hypothetical protein
MNEMIPAAWMPYLTNIGHVLGGILLMVLGLSFGYKFIEASFMGRVNYWGGLEKVHWLFHPITMFFTPFFVHTKPKDTNLIKTRTAGYVHLVWGPLFFLLSLMLMVSGADFLSLPGTAVMNFVLTCGRHDIPQAIVYQPPPANGMLGTYKFPILKKARRTVFRLLTADIYMDKKKVLNTFEREGKDTRGFTGSKLVDPEEEEEDRIEAEQERLRQQQQAPQPGK